jgi:hypothetical protein
MDGWMHQLISFYFMANHAVTNELHGGLSSKKKIAWWWVKSVYDWRKGM